MKNTIVIKRNGSKENFQFDKILRHLKDATKDLKNVDYNEIIANLKLRMKPEMSSKEIQDSLIQSAADLIDKEKPNYQYVAARLMLQDLYKEVYGEYKPHFDSEVLKERIKKGYYADYVLDYYTEDEIDELAKVINYENDLKFTYSGLWQMKKKYMVKREGKPIETPQETFFLVSLYNYIKIKNKRERTYYVKNTYKALSNFEIFLSTPPMVGIRTKMRGWTSCAGVNWGDSVEAFGNAAKSTFKLITKLRAGIGTYLGGIRGLGADIGDGFEKHTGIGPYAKVNEAITRSSMQPNSGRSGAATNYYPFFHWEIEDILQYKNNKGSDESSVRFSDHAIVFDEIFYERLEQGKNITLFHTNDVPGLHEYIGTPKFKELYEQYERKRNIQKKKIPAEYLYKRYFNERYQTARIYKVNGDEFQRHSAFKVPVFFSNLCLAGNTKVETKNGIKELKDVKVGDYVKSYNTETNQIEYKKVTASAMTNPKAKVMKITAKNNEIICTPDHKIWTENRGYVEAKDLKENDKILTDKYENFNIEYLEEEIAVYDITVEDNHNFYANGILVHNCTEISLPAFPDEDFIVKVKNKKEFKKWIDKLYAEGNWYLLYRHFEYGEENEVSKEMQQYLDKNGKNFVLNFGEIFSCILGGLNIGILPLEKEKRIKKVRKLMDILVRFLDEMIDNQDYVNIKPFEKFTKNRRALGISPGNMFYLLARADYDYDSVEARNLMHEIMEEMLYFGLEASSNLAKKRGKCNYFNDTKYSDGILPIDTYNKNVDVLHNQKLTLDWKSLRDKIKKYGLRNSTLLTVVPSSNSSRPANMISGINPPQSLEPTIEDNRLKIKSLLPDIEKYKKYYTKHLAWNIDTIEYWKLVAVIQKFVDQAISLNEYVDYTKYPNKQLPYSEAVRRDFFTRKYGIKTLYYAKSKTQENIEMKIKTEEGCSGGGCTL